MFCRLVLHLIICVLLVWKAFLITMHTHGHKLENKVKLSKYFLTADHRPVSQIVRILRLLKLIKSAQLLQSIKTMNFAS